MDWSNEAVLKFLNLYQKHRCLWHPKDKYHKNRARNTAAWNDIVRNIGIKCTIPQLKKKKESLMSAYRAYKSKVKRSLTSEATSGVYQPVWYAFSTMDSFLGSVYGCNPGLNTEMPLSAAEKQKKYREKLKNENPQKYEEIQRKAKERSARYYEKKKSTFTEDQKQELRKKWKKDRAKAKVAKMTPQNEPSTSQDSNSKKDNNQLIYRKMQCRIEYRLKQENTQLRLKLNTLSKGFKGLQKKIIRQQNKIDRMQENYENVFIKLATENETVDTFTQESEEKTPREKNDDCHDNEDTEYPTKEEEYENIDDTDTNYMLLTQEDTASEKKTLQKDYVQEKNKSTERGTREPPERQDRPDRTVGLPQTIHIHDNEDDESGLYAKFLAKKLRRLTEERRNFITYKIDKLFYEESYSRSNTSGNITASSIYIKSSPNYQEKPSNMYVNDDSMSSDIS